MSTGARMMVCLHFYTLLLQWTSTMLRRYQARLFDLKSQFCGPYICLYSECGQSISWLLTSGTACHSQPEGSNSQRNVFNGECLFINLKNMNLDNISPKNLYGGKFNVIFMGVMARFLKLNFIY